MHGKNARSKNGDLMKFTFTSKDGHCPECTAFGRKWYIKDRYLYDNVYEYCLMSIPISPPAIYQFQDKKAVALWLNGFDHLSEREEQLIDFYINRWIQADCSDMALVEKNGIQYRYDKVKNTLTSLPERRQESCWYDKYCECLADAKALLAKKAVTLS